MVDVIGYAALLPEVRMKGMRFTPKGYGGERRPDQVKRDGWKEQGVLAVAVDDDRLTWPERELVRQLGEKLYGKRAQGRRAMAEWTRDMVEDARARGRPASTAASCRPCGAGLLQHLAGHAAQSAARSRQDAGADAGLALAARDQPAGGDLRLDCSGSTVDECQLIWRAPRACRGRAITCRFGCGPHHRWRAGARADHHRCGLNAQ